MTKKQMKQKAAGILRSRSIESGMIHMDKNWIVAHNTDNSGNSMVFRYDGMLYDQYRTPDRGDLLKHRTHRNFFIVGKLM